MGLRGVFRLIAVVVLLAAIGCVIQQEQPGSAGVESTVHGASDRLSWQAEEVVRELYQQPHLLTRVTLTGIFFPQRALEPFVIIGETRSRFVEIAEDGLRAHAYFDEPLPHSGPIRFGYGRDAEHRILPEFHPDAVKRLDRKSLPENVRLPGQSGQ